MKLTESLEKEIWQKTYVLQIFILLCSMWPLINNLQQSIALVLLKVEFVIFDFSRKALNSRAQNFLSLL